MSILIIVAIIVLVYMLIGLIVLLFDRLFAYRPKHNSGEQLYIRIIAWTIIAVLYMIMWPGMLKRNKQ
jgi:hypothetical protein